MRNALLSVFHKEGIVDFARELIALDWRIFSSGGTAKKLQGAGVSVTDVAELSGLTPILGHRVVTLVSQVHGGLLATDAMREELDQLGYPWIDLACVDLYPLKEETEREGATRESVIDKTDIVGPTLIRSAAKGRRLVIVDPKDRVLVISWIKAGEPDGEEFRNALAAKAEAIIAGYCLASARFHSGGKNDGTVGRQIFPCKYGENAWQTPAGLFAEDTSDPLALWKFTLVDGDAPSFNTWCDIDRLLQTVTHAAAAYEKSGMSYSCIAVGVKHGNACGAGVGTRTDETLWKMIKGNPIALFGGLVVTTFPVGREEAITLREWGMESGKKRLLDGVIASSFSEEAVAILGRKGGKCRMLQNPALATLGLSSLDTAPRRRPVRGGFLKQPNYSNVVDFSDPELERIGKGIPLTVEDDMLLAWAIGSTSNSNTVTLVKDKMLIGNGVGQQDRVGAAKLAVQKARESAHNIDGAVAYSDSFFPFPDGPAVLVAAGVRAIFASSASVNDEATREVCRANGVTLYLLPDKKCRGFFGH